MNTALRDFKIRRAAEINSLQDRDYILPPETHPSSEESSKNLSCETWNGMKCSWKSNAFREDAIPAPSGQHTYFQLKAKQQQRMKKILKKTSKLN